GQITIGSRTLSGESAQIATEYEEKFAIQILRNVVDHNCPTQVQLLLAKKSCINDVAFTERDLWLLMHALAAHNRHRPR
ncbi:MAG: hypothetical protein ABIF77_10280, partial [bacterium]